MKRFSTIIALVIICMPAFSSGYKYLKVEVNRLSGSPTGDKMVSTSAITSESLYNNYSKMSGFSVGASYLLGYHIEVGAAFSHSNMKDWRGSSNSYFPGASSQINMLQVFGNINLPIFRYNVLNTISLYLGGSLSYGSVANSVYASFVKTENAYEFMKTSSAYLYKRNAGGAGLRFGANIDIPYYNLGVNIGKSFNINKVEKKGFIYDDAFSTSLWEVGVYFKLPKQSRRIIKSN
ncbi:hypothetical protein [uncultured Acetobacteroides sp.]|uniref:hypothetical protein n=1 Tax=uncultured Acetobacteroides sp. TaxID=1760811 RepID=UPI0029F4D9D2|nr:hypothetical protein [uncultured Acetobacteroides sp.]